MTRERTRIWGPKGDLGERSTKILVIDIRVEERGRQVKTSTRNRFYERS